MKKKVVSLVLASVMAVGLAACSQNDQNDQPEQNDQSDQVEQAEQDDEEDQSDENGESYKIGIIQFAEHGSLDNCREGFLAGLEEEGIVEGENLTIEFQNAQADTGTTSTIASSYVSQGMDMICAIATPAAMSAYNACMDTDIPVIFTAVSDPVAAELANEDGTPAGNVSGTSDALAVDQQLQMIRTLMPDAKTIGIIYTTSETNSISTIETYKELAGNYDFEIVETGISVVADVESASVDLASKVDCITNLTDNTVVSGLQTELAAANAAGIPVFGSEIEQVKAGCVAAMGIEYIELGKQTGRMAAKVLKGEASASELNFETIESAGLYINIEAAQKVNLEIPDGFDSDAVEVFDEIVVE